MNNGAEISVPSTSGSHVMKAEATPKYICLEIGRGFAASLVAAHHASRMMVWSGISPVQPFDGIMNDFHVGVDFFFVLSGFLVSWIHWADIGRPGRLRRYALRRFTRVYPAYWLVLFALIFFDLVSGHLDKSNILPSVLLLPTAHQPILGVAWSLVYEIFFYVIFGCAILFGRVALILMPVWAAAILAVSLTPGPDSFPVDFLFNAYNLEFLLGIGVAALLRKVRVAYAPLALVAGCLVFIAGMTLHADTFIGGTSLAWRAVFGSSAALVILGLIELERSGRLAPPSWFAHFGGASYAIYLVHPLVYNVVMKLLRPHLIGASPELLTVLLTLTGIAGGIAFHKLLERHVTRWVRNILSAWLEVSRPRKPAWVGE